MGEPPPGFQLPLMFRWRPFYFKKSESIVKFQCFLCRQGCIW